MIFGIHQRPRTGVAGHAETLPLRRRAEYSNCVSIRPVNGGQNRRAPYRLLSRPHEFRAIVADTLLIKHHGSRKLTQPRLNRDHPASEKTLKPAGPNALNQTGDPAPRLVFGALQVLWVIVAQPS